MSEFAEPGDLGAVLQRAAYVLSDDPPTLRVPDVSFVRSGRLPLPPEDEYLRGAPDLAVEIVSPSDTAEDLTLKVRQYLAAGSEAVWVVYPKTREVHVFEPAGVRVLSGAQRLEAPALLPGWSVPVAKLFE